MKDRYGITKRATRRNAYVAATDTLAGMTLVQCEGDPPYGAGLAYIGAPIETALAQCRDYCTKELDRPRTEKSTT